MKKQFLVLFLLFIGLNFTTSCGDNGGGTDPENALNSALQGSWNLGTVTTNPGNFINTISVTFTSTDLTSSTGNFTLVLNGQTISGTFNITSTSTSNGAVTLNLNSPFNGSSTINLTNVSISGNTLTFTADINDNKQVSSTFSFELVQ